MPFSYDLLSSGKFILNWIYTCDKFMLQMQLILYLKFSKLLNLLDCDMSFKYEYKQSAVKIRFLSCLNLWKIVLVEALIVAEGVVCRKKRGETQHTLFCSRRFDENYMNCTVVVTCRIRGEGAVFSWFVLRKSELFII